MLPNGPIGGNVEHKFHWMEGMGSSQLVNEVDKFPSILWVAGHALRVQNSVNILQANMAADHTDTFVLAWKNFSIEDVNI